MCSFGGFIAKIMPMSDVSNVLFPPPTKFLPERDMPSLAGKLLLHDAKVYLAARSSAKGMAAVDRLKLETGKDQIEFLELDLGDLTSVRKATESYLQGESTLDVLFNNAGVMIPPTEPLTAQGYDLQFGTNFIGPYLFTTLLIPALKRVRGRIINTSSSAHNYAPAGSGIEFGSLTGGAERDAFIKSQGSFKAPWSLYGKSKLANILIANLWARELKGEVTACSLHPGGIKTEIQRHAGAWQQQLANVFLHPIPKGAWTQLYAGTTAPASAVNGKFFNPWARIHKCNPQGDVITTQELLRDWLDEQVAKY